MSLPPDLPPHSLLTTAFLNSILDTVTQLVSDFGVVAATQNVHTGMLTAIQTQGATNTTDINNLKQLVNVAASPAPPGGLGLVNSTVSTLTVSWASVSGTNISYLVEYEAVVGGTWTALPTTAATTVTIAALASSTPYSVRVSSVAGNFQGPPGTPQIFTTATPVVQPPVAPVVAPVGTPSTSTLTVQWNLVANATSYEVGYLIAGVWTSIVTTNGTTTTATLVGLTAGTAYTVSVRGDNGAVLGSLSSGVVITTTAAGPTPPAQPVSNPATGATANSINFSWVAFAAIGSPPADPGVAAPSLTIAPGASYKFQNIAFANTAQQNNTGFQDINVFCTGGTLSCTLVGTTIFGAANNGTTYLQITGVWADLLATAKTIVYHAGVAGSDTIGIELWVAGSVPPPQTGTIPVTITGGATVETGGYNPTGGATFVPSISADAGVTWVASPPQTANSITFGSLTSSHSYQMRVHAVSQQGVAGIESAVQTLSTAAPGSGVIGDPTGTQAVRAHDFAGTFGTNAYITSQDGVPLNQLAPCLTYLMGGTGHRLLIRFYIDGGNGAPFVTAYQNLINSNQIMAWPVVNHFNTIADPSGVVTVINGLAAADIAAVEGPNEPTNTGFGALTPAYTLTQQQTLYTAAHAKSIKVVMPSVLFRASDQVTWWGASLGAALAAADYNCSHLYPNNGCWSASNQMLDWHDSTILGNLPFALTETNDGIYNPPGVPPAPPGYDQINYNRVSGWHFLCMWANGFFKQNMKAFIWFSMGDYPGSGWSIPVGLFTANAASPHLYTTQFAAFLHLIADTGATRATFTPGLINCVATGLPTGSWQFSGGQLDWVQTSTGDFYGLLRNEQNQFSGATGTVHLAFGTTCALIEDYGITGIDGNQASLTPTPRTTLTNTNAIDVVLGTEFRVIHVRKPP